MNCIDCSSLFQKVNRNAINNNVLAKIFSAFKTRVVRNRRLINRPVVEWRVNNWIFCLSEIHFFLEMDGMTINDDVLAEIGISIEAYAMFNSRLVDRPVVEWRVDNWIFCLSEIHFFLEMDGMTIDDDVLTKIFISFEAYAVSNCWLIDRPVVEGRVDNWVLSQCDILSFLEMYGMTIDDDVLTKIFISFEAHAVSNGWLVDRPVVERRINNWIFAFSVNLS
jgi:hypothetical protein